jgi:hypothetical protein
MGVLLVLMTIGGSIAALVLLAVARLNESSWLKRFVLGGTAIWFGFYFLMLIGVSLNSSERTLAVGEAKEYCGFYLDCHMHTAVTGVRTAKTLGNVTAKGAFHIIKVKVFSDANREALGLLNVDARVVDEAGNTYERDLTAEAQLAPQPEFERQTSPDKSFEKEIIFDLPARAVGPRLDIREGYAVDRAIEAFVIGDEDSLMHKRNYFDIGALTPAAAR